MLSNQDFVFALDNYLLWTNVKIYLLQIINIIPFDLVQKGVLDIKILNEMHFASEYLEFVPGINGKLTINIWVQHKKILFEKPPHFI